MASASTPEHRARERAIGVFAMLGVAGTRGQHERLLSRIELLVWRFLVMRWYDAHRFFESVESKEAKELVAEGYRQDAVWRFFSDRHDRREFENAVVVGLSLLFAALRKATSRGADPRRLSAFTLQRMMEVALDEVDDLRDLLRVGAPPEAAG